MASLEEHQAELLAAAEAIESNGQTMANVLRSMARELPGPTPEPPPSPAVYGSGEPITDGDYVQLVDPGNEQHGWSGDVLEHKRMNGSAWYLSVDVGGGNVQTWPAGLCNLIQPPTEPDVKLTEIGRVLATGPYPTAGIDYSGQQIGALFARGKEGAPAWSNGWPSYTRPQGQRDGWCKIKGHTGNSLLLELSRAGHPYFSATTLFEQHIPLDPLDPNDGGYPAVAYAFDYKRHTDEAMRTIKLGGLVGFNRYHWPEWPGGGANPGEHNFSVRAILNSDDGNGPRYSSYFYLGADNDPKLWTITHTEDPRITVSNKGRTIEVVDRNGPAPEAFKQHRVWLECIAGTERSHLGGIRMLAKPEDGPLRIVMQIEGIMWATKGPKLWTRGYPVVMYGGRDESFEPKNQAKTGIVELGGIHIAELAG